MRLALERQPRALGSAAARLFKAQQGATRPRRRQRPPPEEPPGRRHERMQSPGARGVLSTTAKCSVRRPAANSATLTLHRLFDSLRSKAPPSESSKAGRDALSLKPRSTATEQHDATRAPRVRHAGRHPELSTRPAKGAMSRAAIAPQSRLRDRVYALDRQSSTPDVVPRRPRSRF